jgi:SAM-dependent methyltransferase
MLRQPFAAPAHLVFWVIAVAGACTHPAPVTNSPPPPPTSASRAAQPVGPTVADPAGHGRPPASPVRSPTGPTEPATSAPDPDETSAKPGINDRFLDPTLNVDRWQSDFEGESREVSVHRDAIVAALAIRPGDVVADIGAGTGLFLPGFNRAVGAAGAVYAVEIAPRFIDHLRQRVANERLTRVTVHRGQQRSVDLPTAAVDLAFVCDTYHHFEYPHTTLASIRQALRPGGRLVIVDFERVSGRTRPWLLDHVRAGKEVFRAEIEAAGFRFLGELAVPGLKENYALTFRRD